MSFSIKIAVFVSLLTLICAVRRHLSEPDTARIVQLLEDGQSQRQVAMRFEISQSVVSRIWTRFRETGRYTRRPGQGRHRMTTPQEDRYLRIIARRNRFDTARQIEMDFRRGTGVHLSDQTTRNRLPRGPFARKKASFAPYLDTDAPQSPPGICPGPCKVAATPLAYSVVYGREQVPHFNL